jgi:hypothetical protein
MIKTVNIKEIASAPVYHVRTLVPHFGQNLVSTSVPHVGQAAPVMSSLGGGGGGRRFPLCDESCSPRFLRFITFTKTMVATSAMIAPPIKRMYNVNGVSTPPLAVVVSDVLAVVVFGASTGSDST